MSSFARPATEPMPYPSQGHIAWPSAIILIVLIIIISSIILVYLIHFDIYVNHYVIDAICGIYSISVSSGCSCDIIFRFYHHNYYF